MVAVYVFASIGIMPTPAILAHWFGGVVPLPESAQRFPCDDHACGCVTASECWLHCCCHGPHQRLVWAVTHGVRPPAEVKFSQAQWLAAVESAKSESDGTDRACATAEGEKGNGPARGISISALACKGIQQILATSVPPAMPLRASEMMTVPAVAPASMRPRNAVPDSRSLDVPEPPPRLG
mgnify:CR=1 FL=1